MQVVLLKSIVASVGGSGATGIVDLLYEKKNVNEFLIAKKLKLTINQTRNVLYKLADEGLVSFIRKKDNKKGGWYTYFWTLNTGKSLIKFREKLENTVEELRKQISNRKSGRFFVCLNCNIEFNEETSLTHNYSCPECGEVLNVKDISTEIAGSEKELIKLESALIKVNEEVAVLNSKEEKSKIRKMKVEQKKKINDRAILRKKRAAEKKRLVNKEAKSKKKLPNKKKSKKSKR